MSKRQVLYQTIYKHLKRQIESGELKPGQQLAVEREIMERFGVSRMTTTRALNLLVSEHLITRMPGRGTYVLGPSAGAADRPNEVGRSSDHSVNTERVSLDDVIGFVTPFLNYSFGPSMLVALEKVVNQRGGILAVQCSYGSQKLEETVIQRMLRLGVKGLIILPVNGEFYNPQILQLHLQEFPIVLVDKSLPGIPLSYVTSDNRVAARELTKHLIELGHRSIGFYSVDPEGTSTLTERFEGFLEALREADIPFDNEWFVQPAGKAEHGQTEEEAQVHYLQGWLAEHPEITGIFASDDELARWALAAIRARGLSVPEDISIVCFDEPPQPAYWTFTAAVQDEMEIARRAVELLFEQMEGKMSEPQGVVVATKIRYGQSSGPAPDLLQ
ncbi:MAG: GntR family transcriptional regulator [Firmicutes bacterium]|nr:GntR family transcriptional regulator [Bacillota bacterium]